MSDAEKVRIIERRHSEKSFDEIAAELQRSQSACSRCYLRWGRTEELHAQLGRPKLPMTL